MRVINGINYFIYFFKKKKKKIPTNLSVCRKFVFVLEIKRFLFLLLLLLFS
jgi:hypothetical protein